MNLTKNKDGTITLTAPVLIPNAKDCDYKNGETPLTKEQIRKFAKSYEHYQFIDSEHGLTRDGKQIGKPVKSFLLSEDTTFKLLNGDTQTYPEGSWFITSQLTDNKAIDTAINGGYTGYSVSVFSKNRADEYLNALKSDKTLPLPKACKNLNSSGTGLIKDVENPVVLSVSLVSRPCLHDSKLCELNGEIMEDDVKSLKSKILTAMGMTEEAEIAALKSEVDEIYNAIEAMKAEYSKSLKTMQEEFKNALEEAMKPVDAEAMKAEEDEPEEIVEEDMKEDDDVDNDVENDDEPEEETIAEKGHSKAEPVHDVDPAAEKSKPQNIYEALGRNPDGTRKLQL